MNALLGFVVLYLLGTLAIGLYAGTQIEEHTSELQSL